MLTGIRARHLPLLALAMLSLLAAAWGGLVRLGWAHPAEAAGR